MRHEAWLVEGGLAVGEHDVSILQSVSDSNLGHYDYGLGCHGYGAP
jgi:hypothetical protein